MSEVINGTGVEREYEVESAIVTLAIIIGEGQIGASVVFLDDQVIAKGDVNTVILGPGSILTGRRAVARSLVSDINPNTDRTAVTYILGGGATELDVTLTQNDAPNGSVIYQSVFNFREKAS